MTRKNKINTSENKNKIKSFINDFKMTYKISDNDKEKINDFFHHEVDLKEIKRRRKKVKMLRGY